MMRICVLSSGSKGNAVYVESDRAALLIDAGLSAKEIIRRLGLIQRSPAQLDGILVTHEHVDHIRAVGTLSRRYGVPVYISEPTLRCTPFHEKPLKKVVELEAGVPFSLQDMTIHPFEVTHDATNPINFTIRNHGAKVGISTDLGYASTLVKESLKGCRALIVETNHDPEMLELGPYPWPVKQRVKSKRGHLSNEQGAKLLREVLHKELKHICLAHLSETNNRPQKAVEMVRKVLGRHLEDIRLHVASQHRVGPVLEIE